MDKKEKCSMCYGYGFYSVGKDECCGSFTKTGSCCNNPKEVEAQEPCFLCNGTGYLIVTD